MGEAARERMGASMIAHHPAGPSQLGRIVLCPGSMNLAERARREGSALSPYAAEAQSGTDLHALLPPDVPIPDDLEPADRAAVEAARAWVAEKLQGRKARYEERVTLSSGIFGTVDVIAPHVILDVKFGRAPLVPAAIEWQMKAYVASQYDGCEVAVFHARERTEYTASFTAADCERLDSEIHRSYGAAQQGDAPLRPSPDACRYCPATGICPAFRDQMMVPVENLPEEETALDLTPLQVSRWLQLFSIIGAREDAIKERAKEILLAGGSIPGYHLKSMETRKLPSKEELIRLIDSTTLLRAASFTIGHLEKTLGRAEFARVLGPHISTTTSTRLERA